MPLLANPSDLENNTLATNHYGYSSVRIDTLGATEYTLASIVVDVSGSVDPFLKYLEDSLVAMTKANGKSPRKDNLMQRVTTFSGNVSELNGFVPLSGINADDYRGKLRIGSVTALYDASENAVEATTSYAMSLFNADYSANAIVVVITDGLDNVSKATESSVKKAIERAHQSEALESLITILIGVNMSDSTAKFALEQYAQNVGFTDFIAVENADEKTLAKIANYVSQSISSQSQALGTGGPSKSLTF